MNQGARTCSSPHGRKAVIVEDTMVFWPDELLDVVLGWMDVPADYARCACVNRQWRASSRSAHPHHLVIDWQDSFECLNAREFWMCDKIRRGRLNSVKDMTLDLESCDSPEDYDGHLRSIKTIISCLPLESCTLDSDDIGCDVYSFLPDSIRHSKDKQTHKQFGAITMKPFRQACFRNLGTFHVAIFGLLHHCWLSNPPTRLRHLTVTDCFFASHSVLPRLAELFPALVSFDVAVLPSISAQQQLQELLLLPHLAKAHVRFSERDIDLGPDKTSRMVLIVSDTVALRIELIDGLKVERTIQAALEQSM